jgi:tetratricopeptide (TPR) repeat protein
MDVVQRALSPADRTWGVLVDGIGGIGKTALAIEAAHRAQDAGAFDAFVFITAKQSILKPSGIQELTPPARTLDDFLNETARLLGQPGIPKLEGASVGATPRARPEGDDKRRALLDVLRATRALLIYDNLETLSKEEQEQVADFLRELPQHCKAIITSRRRGGEGAVWLRVEKMDWDAARGIIENEMARDVGLANKLQRVESRWQELFDETNGSPLALVHTLGLMRVRATLTFDGALEMLRRRGGVIPPKQGAEQGGITPPQQDDLQKFIFQEARKELTENDKTALGALSFFVPSATFEAWMQVANLSRNALETTIDRLAALSLVDVLAGEERYALHPLTRAFVRDELLADANVARETGMRFAKYWIIFAQPYRSKSKETYGTYDRLEVELKNLHAAGNWLRLSAMATDGSVCDRKAVGRLFALVGTLKRFLEFSGFIGELMDFNVWAYELANAIGDLRAAGWHAYDMFLFYFYRSIWNDAEVWAERCLTVWMRNGSAVERVTGFRVRGMLAEQQTKIDLANQNYELNLAFWREEGPKTTYVASALNDLGRLAFKQGKYLEAEQYYKEAGKLARANNSEERIASYLNNLGRVKLVTRQWTEARDIFEQSLKLAQAHDLITSVADSQHGLARVHEAEGRADLALPLAQDALKIYERLQHKDLAEVRELVERLTNSTNGKRINE